MYIFGTSDDEKKTNLYIIINLLYRRVFYSSSACAVDWYQRRHDCTGSAWANETRVQIIIVAILSSYDVYNNMISRYNSYDIIRTSARCRVPRPPYCQYLCIIQVHTTHPTVIRIVVKSFTKR